MKPIEWLLIITLIALAPLAYQAGREDGFTEGRTAEHGEAAMRRSEHDRMMQQVGVCKWAQIMAEDVRCKQELP